MTDGYRSAQNRVLLDRLALYTTVYPGVEKYLPGWYESVLAQTDRNFNIWIGVDELDISAVVTAVGADLPATWVVATEGDTPAQIRQSAIAQIIDQCPAVVFVDSDDLLDPTRVEAARESLRQNDVDGCAMRLIDDGSTDLEIIFKPPDEIDIATILPRNNVFGLSNTAYRSQILRRCLPIPAECALVDWFLITRAWILGARLGFDFIPRMAYRQHGCNMARVLPPFTPQQIILAARLVLNHYTLILENISEHQSQHRIELEIARNRVEAFCEAIKGSPDTLHQYVQALNKLPPNHIWWACVAHPQLEEIWRS